MGHVIFINFSILLNVSFVMIHKTCMWISSYIIYICVVENKQKKIKITEKFIFTCFPKNHKSQKSMTLTNITHENNMFNLKCIYLFYFWLFIYLIIFGLWKSQPDSRAKVQQRYCKGCKTENGHIKCISWLYIVGVQLNFYQNITEICILFSNKVLGMTIHFI